MSKLIIHKDLRVSHSQYGGFGVFTDTDIPNNTVVEQCHPLIFDEKFVDQLPKPLQMYVFQWVGDDVLYKKLCLPLGFGAIYNHSRDNNLSYKYEWLNVNGEVKPVVTYFTIRDIKAGEELFVSYGNDYFKYFNIKEYGVDINTHL